MIENNPRDELENFNKRLRTMFTEIDELKTLNERLFKQGMRIEAVEARIQENWLMCEDIKRSIPPSSEHLLSELKQITVSI